MVHDAFCMRATCHAARSQPVWAEAPCDCNCDVTVTVKIMIMIHHDWGGSWKYPATATVTVTVSDCEKVRTIMTVNCEDMVKKKQ